MKTLLESLFVASLFITCSLAQIWGPDTRLTYNDSASNTSFNNARCISASSDTLHITWGDERIVQGEIFYKRSTDSGLTWGQDIQISNTLRTSAVSSIANEGSYIHIVWNEMIPPDYEIYYNRSTDSGANWGSEVRLTNAPFNSVYPSLSVSDNYVYVVWQDRRDGNDEIYFKRSTDRGSAWESDKRLSNHPADSWYPSCASVGNNIHIAWMDYRDWNYEIYYKRSTDRGMTWEVDTRLTSDSLRSSSPSISVWRDTLFIAWVDNRDGNPEIYIKRSTDGGTSWMQDRRLTYNSFSSQYPSIYNSGMNVYLVWQDYRDGNSEIYYKRSIDGGVNWSLDERLTNNSENSMRPFCVVENNKIHIIWSDERDLRRYPEIYYKRGELQTGIENKEMKERNSSLFLSVFPNPSRELLHIYYSINESNKQIDLSLYDIQGRKIHTFLIEKQTRALTLPISNLQEGFYFLKLSSEKTSIVRKFLKL